MSNVLALAGSGSVSDATIFLSTVALVVGVCVGIVGAGILQLAVIEKKEPAGPSRLPRMAILIVLFMLDAFGVLFPLGALYSDTINGSIAESTVRTTLIVAFVTILGNLLLPAYVVVYSHTFRWIRGLTPIIELYYAIGVKDGMDGEKTKKAIARIGEQMVAAKYVDAATIARVATDWYGLTDQEILEVAHGFLRYSILGMPGSASMQRLIIFKISAGPIARWVAATYREYALSNASQEVLPERGADATHV
jgi:hypothetical protein